MDNGLCSLDTAHSDWHCDAVFTVRGGSFVPSPHPPSGGRHLAAVSRQVPVRKEKAWLAPTSSCTAQQRGEKNNTKTCALSNVMGYIYIYKGLHLKWPHPEKLCQPRRATCWFVLQLIIRQHWFILPMLTFKRFHESLIAGGTRTQTAATLFQYYLK